MKNQVMHSRPRLAPLLCLSILLPLVAPTAGAQNSSQITVEVGQPNIWSLGQAHYLLAGIHIDRKHSRRGIVSAKGLC